MTHARSFGRPLARSDILKGALAYLATAAVVLGPLAVLLWWLA